jgi:hypothetical protein
MALTYNCIATTTLASANTDIVFSSISSAYTDLRVVVIPVGGGGATIGLRFNSDTGTNYSYTLLRGSSSGVLPFRENNATRINGISLVTGGMAVFDVLSYAGSTQKAALCFATQEQTRSDIYANLWRNTAAITTVTVNASSNMGIGTRASVYGILRA